MKEKKTHFLNSGEYEAVVYHPSSSTRATNFENKFPKTFEHDTKQQKEGVRMRFFTLVFHLHLIGEGGVGCEVVNVGTASTLQRPEDF